MDIGGRPGTLLSLSVLQGYGALDIWVTRRATTNNPWAEPVNLGSVVNSAHQDVALYL